MWNLFKINIETPERHKSRRFGVFINFEQIVHTSGVSFVEFKPVGTI